MIASAAARLGDAVMVGDLVASARMGLASGLLTRYIGEVMTAHSDVRQRLTLPVCLSLLCPQCLFFISKSDPLGL